ncbi:ABC transporter [Sporosarcina sp. P20a]|uniref:Vga family ABC-F type ribosomal protection protein n=1 Tax=Sporosarcina sp. P20a TaxID=2048256 RepID=UPI000C16DF5F|nr:Vga family ABC-F type ribosomal protection protein [Sporosarcina sp. P20a]PIC87097.1 ABC transporter [Sporosarcina sp. P20a]
MIIVEANHIKHYIQDRLLLDIDQLVVHAKDRIGIVGRNGSGKTTLLNILAKKVVLEGGQVIQHASVELLPQLKRTDTAKSGGEITQEYIQQALASDAALLLADEPTTNLDTEHIEWVEKKLNNWPGALILISHDRTFLDSLCTTIWEIDEGRIKEYKGNYTQYSKQKDVEFQQKQQAFEKYQKQKHHLEEAIKQKEEQAQRATKKPKNLTGSEARIKGVKPYFANKQKKLRKTVSAFETRLENLETIEKQKDISPIQMNLPDEGTLKNQVVLRAEKVHGMVGERVLWNDASFYIRGGDKVAVIGSNGTGKTTLIKKIIEKETNITVSPSVKIGYFTQNLSILDLDKTILQNVQSTSTQDETLIRTVLARMHFFTDDVYKSVNVLSGGERVKVALTKIFLSDVNMLVLDEPTNYLDLESLEALETLLKQYKGIIIFVSHDRKFIENVSTRIIDIQNKELIVFDGIYEQYKSRNPIKEYNLRQNELLLLETKISEIISRLSVNPTKELEKEFQRLLSKKRELQG